MESILISLLPSWVNRVLEFGETILLVELKLYKDDDYFQNQIAEWIEELKLTQTQIEQLKMIEIQYFSRTSQLTQELYQAEFEFDKLVVSRASSEQVQQEQRKHMALKIKAVEVFTKKFLAIREVLNQAQILQLCASQYATVEQLNFDNVTQRLQKFYENCSEKLQEYLKDDENLNQQLQEYLKSRNECL